MDHVCTHVPHLDLVDIGQNVSATVRLIVSSDPVENDSNCLTLWPRNPKILGNMPHFHPGKFFFHFDITYHERQVISSRFMRKPLIAKLLKRCLLVATEVPHKSQLTLEPCH